jgi:hypothetical protein
MEHRREGRIPIEQPIVLTLLGEPEIRLAASVKNASPRGIGVVIAAPVNPGAAVKIEIGDSIFLGEATHCRTTEDGYFVGIELTEVLTGLAALSKLAQEFQEVYEPAAQG